MPFLFSKNCLLKSHINPYKYHFLELKRYFRKEDRGFAEIYGHELIIPLEKASVSASKGSITVESACCIPLFVLAAVCLIWMLEIQVIRLDVKSGMQDAGKKMAEELSAFPVFSASRFQNLVVESIGESYLEQSIVSNGTRGLDCHGSYMTPGSHIMELKTDYAIKIPLPIFGPTPVRYSETMRIKVWSGYEKTWINENWREDVVYITENGVVCHKDPHCTYLEPSVRMVDFSTIEAQRNEGNGKYHPCERCMKFGSVSGVVYITDYGTKYHCSLRCSGLKRTIYAIPISEAGGKSLCTKCGK